MTALPSELAEHLSHPSLDRLWQLLRDRLERNGHAIRGVVQVDLDDVGADRVAGLLGHRVPTGTARIRLAGLDAALRAGAAQRGLVAVVAELTGSPLRDRPAERAGRSEEWATVWTDLDADLLRLRLSTEVWTTTWVRWLHTSGIVTRLGPDRAAHTLRSAVATLAEVHEALTTSTAGPPPMRSLGELASRTTGDAHGLDDGRTLAALVLRAGAIALDEPPPESSADRRRLWQQLGVETDLISSSVLVHGFRPPGGDAWSRMMNLRAEQGLITYLTLHELRRIDAELTPPDEVVHGCENPQVLQALADAGVRTPLLCVAGNPSGAAMLLLQRVRLRYHGDFDWPGIAIANRIYATGAEPWRMGAGDYMSATASITSAGLPLVGAPQPTPWDIELSHRMTEFNVAVHEESMIDQLLTSLA